MKHRLAATAFIAALAFVTASQSNAQVNSAVASFATELGRWNAILHDDLTFNGSHSQSGLAVGDQATLANSSDINQQNAFGGAYAFRVYGQLTLTGNESKSLNGGAAVVKNASTNAGLNDFPFNNSNQRVLTFAADPNTQPRLFFNGNSGSPAPALFLNSGDTFFSSRYTSLSAASSIFDSATGLAPVKTGKKLTFAASANGNATVFDWDVAAQGSINEVELIAPVNSNLIINVLNAGVSWAPSFNVLGANQDMASRVLWNLAGGLDLVTNRAWYGSILGPDSTITANENIDGQIFAEDLTFNNRELHYVQFAAIPEPSAYALMLAGVVFLLVAIFRSGVPAALRKSSQLR